VNPDIDDVLEAVAARLQGAGLSLAGTPVEARKSKQPHQEEGESRDVQFTVCAKPQPKDVRRFTSLHDLHTYRLQVVLWSPGNRERLANLPDLAALEDAVQTLFDRRPDDLMGLDGVRDVKAATSVFLDLPAYLQGWDASATEVSVEIVRDRP